MTKIVNLQTYRTKALEQRAFEPWRKRFGELYVQTTKLEDLSDRTLFFLASPGEESAVAFYEIIMGTLDLGTAVKFYYLEKKEQMAVMDIHLFLADNVRFEMLRRLKWLSAFPCENHTIIEMIQDFDKVMESCRENSLKLAPSHSGYAEFSNLTDRDKETYIRRMFPQALKTYKKKLGL